MRARVTCAGVVIGTAQFDQLRGLAHASLSTTADYASSSRSAKALGRRLARTEYWPAADGDFADAAAARWKGRRLALEDMAGRAVNVRSLGVVEGQVGGPDGITVRIVADFRPPHAHVATGAQVEARARSIGTEGDARTRPAA